MAGCTYIGPEIDPLRDWPVKYCGCRTVPGKSYCVEHYGIVYKAGSAATGKRKQAKLIEEELKELEVQKLIAEQEADMEKDYV